MLDARQIETYRRDGVVVLADHLGADLTAALRAETDRILAAGKGMREGDAVYKAQTMLKHAYFGKTPAAV